MARKRKASGDGGDRRSGEPAYASDVPWGADGVTPELPTSTAEAPVSVGAPGQLSWPFPRPNEPPDSGFLMDSIHPPPHFPDDAIPAMSAMNWLSPDDTMQLDFSTLASFPGGPDGFETLGFPFLAGHDTAEQPAWPVPPEIRSPELPGVAGAANVLVTGTQQSSPSTSSPQNNEGEAVAMPVGYASNEGKFYVDGDPWRAPFKGFGRSARRRSTRCALSPRDETTPGTPFPENTSIDETSNADVPSAQAFGTMLSCIRAEAPLGQGLDLLPLDQLRDFFRLYFQCFHQTFPFLRRDAHFYEPRSHCILLLAICATGSRYSPDDTRERCSLLLFDALETVLGFRAVEFPFETPLLPWEELSGANSGEDPLSVLQAAVLSLIWKVHGGRVSAARGVMAERYRVVAGCRNMELLSNTDTEARRSSGNWDWAKEQSRTRTGLMIWVRSFDD